MMTDTNLIFVASASSLTIGSASVTTNILDLASGLMTSTSSPTTYSAPVVSGGEFLLTSSVLFGEDLGPGAIRLRAVAWLAASATPTSGTNLQIAWQGAVDASSGTYPASFSSLTWNTFAETGNIPTANLAPQFGTNAGAELTLPDWPDRWPRLGLPRFIRLAFIPSGTFSSLSVVFAGVAIQKPDFYVGNYPGGFQVAP